MFRHCKTFYDEESKIWHGHKNILPNYNPNASAGQVILNVLRQNPNKIAQISANNGFKITNKKMLTLSIRVAQNLQLKGYQQEDVIGIIASNSQYLAPVVFGALLCGTPISTLDPSFHKSDIKHIFGVTKPKLIFCDPICYQDVKDSVEELNLNCPIFMLKGNINGVQTVEEFLKYAGNEDDFIPQNLVKGGDQIGVILCSSGTTGLPKGVCASHAAILNDSVTTIDQNDIITCFSTLYWLSGLVALILPTLNGATRIIIDEPFSVKQFFNIIEKYEVTVVFTPPSQVALLLQDPNIGDINFSKIRLYGSGGSFVHPSLGKKMQTYLKNGIFCVGYGMSELYGTGTVESYDKRKTGSNGQICVNTDIKIIDEHGNKLGIGEKGEILIRVLSIKWPGYYGNPEETKKIRDKDGWYHTGDIGYFDNEGYLFIIDRIKDILKYKNFQFFPNEIESIITEISDVVEVCVSGIPDIIYTDLPAAAIVLNENSNLTEKYFYDYVAGKMADFKKLRGGIYFLSDLPKTPSGKIQRRKVKEILIKLYEETSK